MQHHPRWWACLMPPTRLDAAAGAGTITRGARSKPSLASTSWATPSARASSARSNSAGSRKGACRSPSSSSRRTSSAATPHEWPRSCARWPFSSSLRTPTSSGCTRWRSQTGTTASCSSTPREASSSTTSSTTAISRTTRPGGCLPSSFPAWAICTRRASCIAISSWKTCSSTATATLLSRISGSPTRSTRARS